MLKSILQTTNTKLPNVQEVICFQCKDVINVFAFLREVILFTFMFILHLIIRQHRDLYIEFNDVNHVYCAVQDVQLIGVRTFVPGFVMKD